MSIYVECNKNLANICLAKAQESLQAQKLSMDGYASGKFEQVRKQTAAIYNAVYENTVENLSPDVISGDWSEANPSARAEIESCPARMKTFVAYDLVLLKEAGLHPLLIPCTEDLLVGVWLFEDFDYEQPVIRAQEFIAESYEQGGMLLAFSATAQAAGYPFSNAVQTGSSRLKNYICAVDVNLMLQEMTEDMVRKPAPTPEEMAEMELAAHQQQEREAAYQNFLSYIAETIGSSDEALVKEISENEKCRWLLGEEKEGECPVEVRNADSQMIQQIADEVERVLAEFQPKESCENTNDTVAEVQEVKRIAIQQSVPAEIQNRNSAKHPRPLLILGEDSIDPLKERLVDTELLPFVLDLTKEDEAAARARIAGLSPRKPSRRLALSHRLYEENKAKYDAYLQMLESETFSGMSLISLMEAAGTQEQEVYSLPENHEAQKAVFDADKRPIFKAFCEAWEKCIYKTPEGISCFDLTEFSKEEIAELRNMTDAAETVIVNFLTALNKFGYQVGKVYDPEGEESRKEYFRVLMALDDFFVGCLDLLEAKQADDLPEATEEEQAMLRDYQDYTGYRVLAEKAGDALHLKGLTALNQEDLAKLKTLAGRLSDSGLESLSAPIPRQIVRDCDELDKLLKQGSIIDENHALRPRSGSGKNDEIIAVCKIVADADLVVRFANEDKYADTFRLWGACTGDDAYVFALKYGIACRYEKLLRMEGMTQESRKIAGDMVNALAETSHPFSSQQTALLNEAEELLTQNYAPFHKMEKEIFGFMGLDYGAFDETYEDRMLMEYILEWKEMLDEEGVYDLFARETAILERACLGNFVFQAKQNKLIPDQAAAVFEDFFLNQAALFWMQEKGFDLADYEMTARSLQATEALKAEEEKNKTFNALLESFRTQLQTEEAFTFPVVLGDIEHAGLWMAKGSECCRKLVILDLNKTDKGRLLLPVGKAEDVIVYM